MAVFYKNIDTTRSAVLPTLDKSAEVGNIDIKSKLAELKAAITGETDATKRKELQRKLNRMERFDRLQDGINITDNNTKRDVAEILKGKNTETYIGSDLLTLRKKGINIANLTLINTKNPEVEVKSSELKSGDSFTVNFGNNPSLRDQTGAGDILPASVRKIIINGIECERSNKPRPGYYDIKGKYQKIYDGYSIELVTIGTETEEDNKANDEHWKKERLKDMIHTNNDKPLTDLPEDMMLVNEVASHKESIVIRSRTGNVKNRAEFEEKYGAHMNAMCKKYGVPVDTIMGIFANETAGGFQFFGPKSSAKASGIGQIIPSTWFSVNNKLGGRLDEGNPLDQIEAAIYYLKEVKQPGKDWIDAAIRYHTGPGASEKNLTTYMNYNPAIKNIMTKNGYDDWNGYRQATAEFYGLA